MKLNFSLCKFWKNITVATDESYQVDWEEKKQKEGKNENYFMQMHNKERE